MPIFRKNRRHSWFALGLSLLCSCLAFSEPPNLELLKNEIKIYYHSGAYKQELAQIAHQAHEYMVQQIKENNQNKQHKKLAIVFDIDETSLSNYHALLQRDFSSNQKLILRTILAAHSPAVIPIRSLYNDALQQGVSVFFVTGRPKSVYQATKTNLLHAGFRHWTALYMRPNQYHQLSIIPFKTGARANITHKGYTIIASIGDQQSDLQGGFAQKGFKLPNPFYLIP